MALKNLLKLNGQERPDLIISLHFMDNYKIGRMGYFLKNVVKVQHLEMFPLHNNEIFEAENLFIQIDKFLNKHAQFFSVIALLPQQIGNIVFVVANHIRDNTEGVEVNGTALRSWGSDFQNHYVVLPLYADSEMVNYQAVPSSNDLIMVKGGRFVYLERVVSHEIAHFLFKFKEENRYQLPIDIERIKNFLKQYPELNIDIAKYTDISKLPYEIAKEIYKIKMGKLMRRFGAKSHYTATQLREEFLSGRSQHDPMEMAVEAFSIFWLDSELLKTNDSIMFDFVEAITGSGKVFVPTASVSKKTNGDITVKQKQVTNFEDRAMEVAKGGIDLTPANMNLQTQNNGGEIKFHLDPAMLQQVQNAPGFVPVIVNIQPLTDLRLFLAGIGHNTSASR